MSEIRRDFDFKNYDSLKIKDMEGAFILLESDNSENVAWTFFQYQKIFLD